MAEVVSDSEPSPLEALRTGLNMAAALAVSDATSGTGIPPEKQGDMQLLTLRLSGCRTYILLHMFSATPTNMDIRVMAEVDLYAK